MGSARTQTRSLRLSAWILTVAALIASACGSNLDEDQFQAANGSLIAADTSAAGGGSESFGPGGLPLAGSAAGAELDGDSSAPGSGRRSAGTGTDSAGEAAGPGANATFGSGGGSEGGASGILLGSFGTGTGPIGAQVAAAPVGVRAWVADVNARGGLNGHPVRVIIEDDGGDPGKALAIVRKMVEEDQVTALFGGFGATTTHTVGPYLDEKRVPMVGGVPAVTADTSAMIFNPQTGGTKGTHRSYLTTIKEQTAKRRIGFLYCREADTCREAADAIRAYAPKVGIEVVYEAAVSIAQPDYTAEVIAARNAGAEVLAISLDIASVKRVITAAHRQGWRPLFSGASQVYLDNVSDGGTDVEGLLGAATVLPYTTSPKMRPYLDAVQRFVPGGATGEYGAAIWVAGKMMEKISAGFGPTVTRQQILDGLYSLREETLGGLVPPITFPEGPHVDVNLCSYPIKFMGGKWVAPLGEGYVCAPD